MNDDGLAIPSFLKISAARRRAAWARFPLRPMPLIGREISETERAYRASIAAEKAERRARDEVRFKILRARAAALKAERQAVERAVRTGSRSR